MPELRWTLLIIGVVFLAGLAWWELRRSRGRGFGAGGRLEGSSGFAGGSGAGTSGGLGAVADGIRHEPTISFPEPHSRDARHELPVVEVADDDSLIGLRIDGTSEVASEPPISEAVEPIVPAPPPPADAAGEMPPMLGIAPLPAPADPIVDWPDESVRRIVALRLV
ncbi:MAG: hypothetical protein ACREUG_03195, partial [Steroidobacteraceae bacterium]